MFNKTAFTITIGDYGTAVALHHGKKVESKLLINTINEENKPKLEKLFTKNKYTPIYIILDTIDQNYKRKLYPSVNRLDLNILIKRDSKKEAGNDTEEVIQNYIVHKNKELKKWECVFISSARSKEINSWKEFLLKMPNRIVGIYMLPIESYRLGRMILNSAVTEFNLKRKNNITSLITQNKVSGTRQTVFSSKSIIFTRVVSYDFDNENFLERFEQDIFRTNEYLKRIFPNIKIEDVNFINILPTNVIEKINSIKNNELNFINYTPHNIASKFSSGNIIPQNSNFSDILISNIFINSNKKILKFLTPKIRFLEKLHLAVKSLFIASIILIFAFLASIINLAVYQNITENRISNIAKEKLKAEESFKKVKSTVLDGNETASFQVDKLMDFGKVNEILKKNEVDIFEVFKKLELIKKHGAYAKSFSYQIVNYKPKAKSFSSLKIKFVITGEINTPSGNLEDLFNKFDGLILDIKTNFKNYDVKYSELPKNVDFSKKYYNSPFNVEISSR